MRHRTLMNGRRRKALSLTELAIVLCGVGIVGGAIWTMASIVWNDYRLRRMNEQMFEVVQNIRTYYGPMGGIYQNSVTRTPVPGPTITAVLDDDTRRLIPIEMRRNRNVAGGAIDHAFSTIAAGSFRVVTENAGTQFRVRLLGLSRSACMKTLMQMPVLSPEVGAVRIGTDDASGFFTPININNMAAPGTVPLPINATTAAAWCPITATNTNEVYIVFRAST